MNTVYNIITEIENHLKASPNVNTVSFGDFWDIDLNKTSLFSIGHINVNSATIAEQFNQLNISIIFADLVDYDKEDTDRMRPTNLQDILNTQYSIANILIQHLMRGDLQRMGYELEGNPSIEFFKERFDNVLAGVVLNFDVGVKNDASIC